MVDYSKIKIVSVVRKVEDLPGLYRDLKMSLFNVVNVAADERGTYLYIDATERKDPRPIIERWVGRPPEVPKPATSFFSRLFRKIW